MDNDNRNKKIITVSLVAVGFVAAIVIRVILESLAATFGSFAQAYSMDWVRHGVPVAVGFVTFAVLQFHPKVQVWADEVVTELLKVVWPTKKDIIAMTIVVCVMLVISSVIIGTFDFLSSNLVKLIINT